MFANVNGCKIFFDIDGLQWVPDGPIMREKPVCLVMHGGPAGTHCHYLPDLDPLTKTMQLVYIDDRNCGFSELTDITTSTVKQNVEDIEAIREYLGLDKVFILGQSYGGIKAQYYVAHHPEHLYGAIICCTAGRAKDWSDERVAKNVARFGSLEQIEMWNNNGLSDGTFDAIKFHNVMGSLYHGKGKFLNSEGKFDQEAYMNHMIRIPGLNSDVVNYQKSKDGDLYDYDYISDLENVNVPCLCLAGKEDFICDVEANTDIANAIPKSEFHIIPDASHEIFADCPEIVFPIINDFVARTFK